MAVDSIWRRLGEVIGWIVVAATGVVMLTQATGWDGSRHVASLQALTPFAVGAMLVVAAVAVWRRLDAMAAVAAVVGVGAFLLSTPLVVPIDQSDPMADAVGFRAAAVNLLYENQHVDEVADDLEGRDLDLVVFTEFTSDHAETLLAHPIAASLPHRISRDGLFAGGVAVWSRFPVVENDRPDTINYTIDSTVDGPDGVLRVLAVHPPTPVYDFDGWRDDLATIGNLATAVDQPTIVLGDFNASYWHPAFRDLLDVGLTDAHMANGAGWSTSWPTDKMLPPFVRLDHALTSPELVSTGVEDFRVPGSDHAGFVVSVSPAD